MASEAKPARKSAATFLKLLGDDRRNAKIQIPDHLTDFHFDSQALMKALAVAAAVFALYFLWGWKKSGKDADEKKEDELPETREELVAKFREASRMKLSSREQILYKYKIFLKIMALALAPKEEFLPPTEYSLRLRSQFPQEGNSFDDISAVFCRTLYGEHQVRPEDVALYDRALDQVLRSFSPKEDAAKG